MLDLLEFLLDTGYLVHKTKKTPMDPNLKLSQEEGDLLEDHFMYKWLIGKPLYLTITRPDLSYSMNRLSQFPAKPRVPQLQAAHHILQYIKSIVGQGIYFSSSSSVELKGFANSNWATCLDTRKSIRAFVSPLEISLFHGNQRSNILFLDLLLKLNIDPWLMLLVK